MSHTPRFTGASGGSPAVMDISGEYFIPMPRERVWASLNDPSIVRQCIPGCRSLERISPTAMHFVVEAKVGPLKSTFNGTLTQSEIDAPRACRLTAAGEGPGAGYARGTADVTLTPEENGTRLSYRAHADVGGKLAEVGGRVIDTAAKHMADQFFGTFAARVGEGAVARAEHAVEEVAHEVAEAAREVEEKAEVAAGRGFLGGPYVWGLLALAVIVALLLIVR
jgi:carbon monoxide dehydrogenase subunit G